MRKIFLLPNLWIHGLIALGLAASGFSQSAGYEGAAWALLDSRRTMDAADELTPAKYPDCDEATVDKRMVRVYRPDGTGEAQDETFVKVFTEKGKRNHTTLSLSFVQPYFTVEVVKLEVLRPGGAVAPVDVATNSKEAIDDSQMAMNISDPHNRVLRVNLPKVEVGDVVHSITRLTTQRSIIDGEFTDLTVFEGEGFVRHLSYEVRAPAGKPLRQVFLRNEIPGTVRHTTDNSDAKTTVHRWEVDRVPRMFDEPAMPPYENVLERLLVSTIPEWTDVSKWYWRLSQPHLDAVDPEMKEAVQKLISTAKTDGDRMKAVFYNVSQTIRYMGLTPEKDRPGFEPHDVRMTFEKKYGVCRDKAALLVSMLRAAGLRAFPVLINVGAKMDPQVPQPDFNHAIVAVEVAPRQYELMDPTDENTRDLLPGGDCDQSYLVCRPEGEDLKVSPVKPPEENMMRVKTTGKLNPSGDLAAHSELWFDGINDNSYRQAFAHMKPDDRRRFFETTLKSAMPGARLKSLKLLPEEMLDMSSGVRAEIDFTVAGLTASGNEKAMVDLPWIGKGLGVVNFILGSAGLEKRKYPMQTYVACGLKEDISLRLAAGYGGPVSIPTFVPTEDACLSYRQQVAFDEGHLLGERVLKLKVVEFSPDQYSKLKSTLKELEYDERKTPVLALTGASVSALETVTDTKPEPVESNARVMESRKELEVKDGHTAVYRMKYSKKILSYAGKIREAEVKLDYNPATQEARIVRACVTSKTGERQEISPGEINIMDAGWNASAKRYTGGRILVANLPGVDIGSTIEVEIEIASTNRPFLSGLEMFQLPDELERKTFKLTAPAGLRVLKEVSGPPGFIRERASATDGQRVLFWEVTNVPAIPAESQLPPEWIYAATVGYFIGDEASYLADLDHALVKHSQMRDKTQAVARQLTASTGTRLEAVRAIRDFVAKSIRLAGPAFTDLPLAELSDADRTLADGYGHSADQAILLHALLEAAGFSPEFVLASHLPPLGPITGMRARLPLLQFFQTPLVRVKVEGQAYYLNDTDQYARLGSTSHDGRLGLSLSTGKQEIIQAAADCANQTDTAYTLQIGDDGRARVGVSRRYYGTHYNAKHAYFAELPPEERNRYYQEVVSAVAQGAHPVGDLITSFDNYPGREEFTVDLDHYAVVDGRYLYFDLPFRPSLFPPSSDRRSLPMFISQSEREDIRTEIKLPPGFRKVVIAPTNQQFDLPCGAGGARITSKASEGEYRLLDLLETKPAIIDPRDYASLVRLESALGQKAARVFLLEKQ